MSISVAVAVDAVLFDGVAAAAVVVPADTAVVVDVVDAVVVVAAVLCMHIKLHPHFTTRFQRNNDYEREREREWD